MKKRIWKAAISLVVVLALVLGYNNIVVLAAQTTESTEDLAGGQVKGILSVDDMSAIATTTYGRGGGYIYATATIYYWWGDWTFKTTVGPVVNTMGGVSATANRKVGGAEVVGALGKHEASWQGTTCVLNDTMLGIAGSNCAKNAIEYVD